jgi:hypothetical protein
MLEDGGASLILQLLIIRGLAMEGAEICGTETTVQASVLILTGLVSDRPWCEDGGKWGSEEAEGSDGGRSWVFFLELVHPAREKMRLHCSF